MWPNPQFSGDLVTFTEEILNRKLHFLCGVSVFFGIIQMLRNAVFDENLTLPHSLVTVRKVSKNAPSLCYVTKSLTPPPLPLLIENTGNNLSYISKRCFNSQLMWFYGYFTNGYSVNSTKVCEEIHDNSDNLDVIVLLKTEHIYLFKRTT